MKKVLLLISIAFLSWNCFGQPTISLSKTLEGLVIADIISDQHGNIFALCGTIIDSVLNCTLHGEEDMALVKIDGGGNIIWEQCYGGSDDEEPYQIIQTADTGFLLLSKTWSADGDVTFNHGLTDLWVVKTDSAGSIEWQKSIGSSAGDIPYYLMQLSNGKYLLACYTLGQNGDFPIHYGSGFDADSWIVTFGDSGVIDTAWHYGGSDNDYITDVHELPNGDFQFFGYTGSNDYDLAGTTEYGNWDAWLFRTDSNGAILWTNRIGGGYADAITSAVPISNDRWLTAGASTEIPGTTSEGAGDVWIAIFDSLGNNLNNFLYGGSNAESSSYQMRLCPTNNGLFTLGAITLSEDGDVSDGHGNYDFWFLTIDSTGSMVNSRASGGILYDILYTNSMYDNNTAMEAGSSDSQDGDIVNPYPDGSGWLIKLEGFDLVGSLVNAKPQVTIYPNPLHDQFMLSATDDNMIRRATLEIYSTQGQLLLTKRISTNPDHVYVKGLAVGNYIYSLQNTKGEIIIAGKLIIQ